MSEFARKDINLFKFYKEAEEEIQFNLLERNIKITGVVDKFSHIPFFFRSYVIISNNEHKIKIFLEEIDENSIFPVNLEIVEKFYRKTIPKSLRRELWKNHFGERFNGSCFVCKERIKKDSFEAGHVIAVSEGGENKLENLRPICKLCNRSMGSMNLEEFKRRYH